VQVRDDQESKYWRYQVTGILIYSFVSKSMLSTEMNVSLNICFWREVWYLLTCTTPVILTEEVLSVLFTQC